jgi:hypothetical protein
MHARLNRGLQTAAAVVIAVVLAVPEYSVAGSESAQVVRPIRGRARFVTPRKSQLETLDYRRVHMKPRQVLVFRPVVRPTKAMPRAFRDDADE